MTNRKETNFHGTKPSATVPDLTFKTVPALSSGSTVTFLHSGDLYVGYAHSDSGFAGPDEVMIIGTRFVSARNGQLFGMTRIPEFLATPELASQKKTYPDLTKIPNGFYRGHRRGINVTFAANGLLYSFNALTPAQPVEPEPEMVHVLDGVVTSRKLGLLTDAYAEHPTTHLRTHYDR